MPIVAYRKRRVHRRRRLIPRRRIFKTKSLYPRRSIYIHKGRFRLFKHRTERQRLFRRFNLVILPRAPQKSYKQTYKPKPKKSKESFKKKPKKPQPHKGKGFRKPKVVPFSEPKKPVVKHYGEKHYTNWSRNYQQYGVWKGGDRGGRRKNYTNYGPMKALGPKLIFYLMPTGRFLTELRKRRADPKFNDWLTIKEKTKEAIDNLKNSLDIYAKEMISRYVPKDTGVLRKSMIESINKSKRVGYTLKVELDTGKLLYANPVNNMPTKMLSHPHIGGRPGLYDPKAQKGWFQFIDMQLNTKARKLFNIFVTELREAWKETTYKKGTPPLRGIGGRRSAPQRVTMPTIVGGGLVDVAISEGGITKRYPTDKPRSGERFIQEFRKVEYRTGIRTQDPAEEDRRKSIRMGQIRENKDTRNRNATVNYPERMFIRGMFKMKGLNRR